MILNKDVLVNNILTELSDNSTGQISPYDIRHNLLDIIDSVHLLTKGHQLDGSNFGTKATRTTRVGEDSLSKIELAGYFSIDNTAVGHSSLKSNYQGIKNTAIGSHSLFCNIYGENNAALGYSALGGNTTGHGNVGLGNFSLNNNKDGNFNIAIGHGAGYYATNASNKLFIASHSIDSNYICDNPLGSGLTPLVHGDFSELQFGIATNNLHSEGTLQVNGNITPSNDDGANLGTDNYRFRYLYLSSGIYLDPTLSISKSDASTLSINGNVIPQTHDQYELGSENNLWSKGYFTNLYVSGEAVIKRFVALENCNYFCSTISLANSGNVSIDGGGANTLYDYSAEPNPSVSECGYLPDTSLNGAGFNISSSGTGYLRTYSFIFAPPNNSLSCLQQDSPYSRASWNSNISIHIDSGRHLKTDRIIFPSSINIVNTDGCFGLFSRGSGIFFSRSDLVSHTQHPSGYLAGVGNVNFYAASGDSSDYIVNFAVPNSGVTIRQRFLNGIKSKSVDILNLSKDKLNGFELQSIDRSTSNIYGPSTDRFIIGSYKNTSRPVNVLTLMKDDGSEGILGINNLSPNSESTLPSTSLNIRSASNAVGRFTAENQASTISAIQLLGGQNCLYDGFEASYLNGSGLADLSMFTDSGKSVYLRFYEAINGDLLPDLDYKRIGILNAVSGTVNVGSEVHGMISIGSYSNRYASISMREYEYGDTPNIDYPTFKPSSAAHRGIYFIGKKPRAKQSHSMFMIDGSGNAHDLVVNPYDTQDGRSLFTDEYNNTFGGLYSPDRRDDLLGNVHNNTAIGYKALYSITNGNDNTIFGANSASGITSGSGNIVVGANSLNSVSIGSCNIVIGTNSFRNSSFQASHNIIIGSDGVGNNTTSSYNFIVGHSGVTLLQGKTGPTSSQKFLSMPGGGKFGVYDNTNTDSLWLESNYISVVDEGGSNYPNDQLVFRFIGQSSAELLHLSHNADPMTNPVAYNYPQVARPYAQLNGDLKLRGAIRFSDSTSVDSASFLNDINVLESGLNTTNNNVNMLMQSFIEGYVHQKIDAPTNSAIPTSGLLFTKNQNWSDTGSVALVNRDTTSVIHSGAYVIAIRVNNEFRPLWISASDTKCQCCR